jgi:hypothetical protein
MTAEQLDQFQKNGCILRAIIILAELKGLQPKSTDEWCADFGPLFKNPSHQFGAIFLSQITEITSAVGLGNVFEVYRSYSELVDWHDRSANILVMSEVDLNLGSNGVCRHMSALVKADMNSFTLKTPCVSGNSPELGPLPASFWDEKLCQAVILRNV